MAARCGIPLLHKARSFADLPDLREAPLLLDEVATMASSSAPVPADRPLALYGAGNLGQLARDFLKAVGQDFVLVIDRNARAFIGCPDWSGVRLVHPDEATKDDKAGTRVAVSVVTSAYVPIERTLLDRGFKDVVPFYDLAESFRHLHPLSNGWFAPPLTENDRNNIARICHDGMMTYRALIICNLSRGAGCARNGISPRPRYPHATGFSSRKLSPHCAATKSCLTPALIMAL